MKENTRAFGCIESKSDARDYALNKNIAMAMRLPDAHKVEHSSIKDQGDVCSCVAHSVCEVLEMLYENVDKFSTNWIYGYRPAGYFQGKGMSIRDALKTTINLGCVPYDDFAGNIEMKQVKEIVDSNLSYLKDKASEIKTVSYGRLHNREQIKRAIYLTGKPVLISIHCVDPFEVDEKNILQYGDNFSGFHCMVCYGWNEYGLLIQNSWGEEWGSKGCCILPDIYPFQEAWILSDDKDAYAVVKPKAFWLRNLWQKIVKLFKK